MSVINQMLNQLEQRGAHQVAEQAMVRAVPKAARNNRLYLLASALVLASGVAVWQWMQAHKPVLSSVEGPAVAAAGVAMRSQNTAAPGNHSGADKRTESATQHPVAQADAPVPGAISVSMPASRLSFELSSVPLPSTARHEPEKAHSKEKAAGTSPHAPVKPASMPARKSAKKKAVKIAGTSPAKISVAEAAAPAADSAMPIKQISPEQRSDAEFRKASALVQQGRIDEAMSGYEAALRLDAG
ncbi:MAG: hypothetical protein WCB93_01145, partial [Gallionella sp.]